MRRGRCLPPRFQPSPVPSSSSSSSLSTTTITTHNLRCVSPLPGSIPPVARFTARSEPVCRRARARITPARRAREHQRAPGVELARYLRETIWTGLSANPKNDGTGIGTIRYAGMHGASYAAQLISLFRAYDAMRGT